MSEAEDVICLFANSKSAYLRVVGERQDAIIPPAPRGLTWRGRNVGQKMRPVCDAVCRFVHFVTRRELLPSFRLPLLTPRQKGMREGQKKNEKTRSIITIMRLDPIMFTKYFVCHQGPPAVRDDVYQQSLARTAKP